MPRFQVDNLTIGQIANNLTVLADFHTQDTNTSNLTIREGIFIKTSGKFNPFKKVVRDAEDSLTNQQVLNEILNNYNHFAQHYAKTMKTDECLDILLNGMYGFLNLGSKYRNRANVDNIANAMSEVSEKGEILLYDRLDWFKIYKKATYNQGKFNRANNVHLGGTCWAMVADWARRFVLKGKMGYAHGLNPLFQFNENKLLHRGKYIAHVHNLTQHLNFQNMGEAIGNMPQNSNNRVTPEILASTNDLVRQYSAEQKGSKIPVVEKFDKLSYALKPNFNYGYICLGNKLKNRNRRLEVINYLSTKIQTWIDSDSNRYTTNNLFAVHGIGIRIQEDVGFKNWSINANPQQNSITYLGGHEVAFGYNPSTKKCYFMDPNFGEWELPCNPQIVAELMYWVFKVYTVKKEKDVQNARYFCTKIDNSDISLFRNTP